MKAGDDDVWQRGGASGQVVSAQSSCPPLGGIRGTALAPAGTEGRGEDWVPWPRFWCGVKWP